MSLTDGDIAALARRVVDQTDPAAEVRIIPADPVDPYRWDSPAWTVSANGKTSYIRATMSADEALAKLAADLNPS
jgi:hypothetical protein